MAVTFSHSSCSFFEAWRSPAQSIALLVPSGLWYVCLVAAVRSPVACGSLLSLTCRCPSYHASFRAGGLEH